MQENEVVARVSRRRFTAAEKARILEEYEAASTIERAAICRRERIYSSHISNWRKQRTAGQPLEAKRGRKADPQAAEITQLLPTSCCKPSENCCMSGWCASGPMARMPTPPV